MFFFQPRIFRTQFCYKTIFWSNTSRDSRLYYILPGFPVYFAGIPGKTFIPTIRKTINSPESETFATYSLNIFRHSLSLVALGQYNLATVLYPAYLLIMNVIITTVMVKPKLENFRNDIN